MARSHGKGRRSKEGRKELGPFTAAGLRGWAENERTALKSCEEQLDPQIVLQPREQQRWLLTQGGDVKACILQSKASASFPYLFPRILGGLEKKSVVFFWRN